MATKSVDSSSLFQQYPIVKKTQNILIDGAILGAITLVAKNSLQTSFTCNNPYGMALLIGAVCYRSQTAYNAVMHVFGVFSRFVGHLRFFHENVGMFFESINSLGRLFYLMRQPFSSDTTKTTHDPVPTSAPVPTISVEEYAAEYQRANSPVDEEPAPLSEEEIFQQFYGGNSDAETQISSSVPSTPRTIGLDTATLRTFYGNLLRSKL